jgi:hypothetical protein
MSNSSSYQSLSIIQFLVKNRFKTIIPFMPLIVHPGRIAAGAMLLATAIPLWFLTEAVAPQVVRAYTATADLAIDRLPGENYETLLRRSEAAARAAVQRSFDQDILATDVSVMVSVQNYGAVAPVLELTVSRQEWRTRPDPQRWATYFRSSRELLYFGENTTNSPTANQTTPGAANSPFSPPNTPNDSASPQPNNTTPASSGLPDPNTTRQPTGVPPSSVPAPPPLGR